AMALGVYHFQRVADAIPFEEISLTRVTPRELLYGLAVRPMAMGQVINGWAHLLGGVAFVAAWGVMNFGGALAPATYQAAALYLALAMVVRGAFLGALSVTGVGAGLRARLFCRSSTRALVRGAMDLLLLVQLPFLTVTFLLASLFI